MSQIRFKRPRRREMTPFRAVFVYGLALLLAAWHQSGRVAEWIENQALEREGRLSENALVLARFLKEKVSPYGPAQLNSLEDLALARLNPEREMGAARTPAPRPGTDRREEEEAPPEAARPPEAEAETEPDPDAWLGRINPDEFLPEAWSPERAFNPEAALAPATPPPSSPPSPFSAPRFDKVLLLGDSMMLEGLGPQLQKELRRRHEGLAVERDGRYGTGLTRLDYFNWLDFFDRMLAKYTPDLVILTIGANDPQDILNPEGTPGRRRILLGTSGWNEIYAARVTELLRLAEDRGIMVFWVGLPIMGREPYGSRVAAINSLTAASCGLAANCRFWDSWLSVADDQGRFTSFAPGENGQRLRLRSRDFIHLTEEGGRIMARKFLAETEGWADYRAGEPAGPAGSERLSAPREVPVAPPPLTPLGVPPLPPQRPLPESALAPPPPPAPETPPAAEAEEFFMDPFSLGPDQTGEEPETGPVMDPPALEPELPPGGGAAWSEGLFYAPALGRETVFRLIEPRGRPGPFPVILLLHGAWDSAASWERELGRPALLALADRLEVVLALPEGGSFGWYLDGLETAMETFILEDFLPEIFQKSVADPYRLAVAGLSMGGHGALTLALKRPDLFQAAGALSAVTDLAAHAGEAHEVDAELAIDKVLGPAGPEGLNWRPFGAAGLWEARAATWPGRPLFLGVGADDGLTLAENRDFDRQLTLLGIDHVYEEKPGGHDWGYWSAELPGLLESLARTLYSLDDEGL